MYVRRIGIILVAFLLIVSVRSSAADWSKDVNIQPRQLGTTPQSGQPVSLQILEHL